MKRSFLALILSATLAPTLLTAASADDSPQFRGPHRDGIYAETGLLQSWPEGGPKRLWEATGLGQSYASISIAEGRIYATGMSEGANPRGSVYAVGVDGKPLWSREYGTEGSTKNYPGTHSTPTVHDGRLFITSSDGLAAALDAQSGEILWTVDLLDEYEAKNIYFGMAESPLVVDGKVIFTPGGKGASLVALDPKTGKTIWTTAGLSDTSAYCSPRLFERGGVRQIVTLVEKNLVGVAPADGKVVWMHPAKADYDIHAVSPVFHDNGIYITHGYNQGGSLVELAADGGSVTEKWVEEDLDVHHGGAVVVDGRIYGAASNKTWHVLDADTGKNLASIRKVGKGSMIYADRRIYGYVESGKVLLVDPDPKNFSIVSSFKIDKGEGHYWSHPVISDGVLYVRHGDVLMAYDVKAAKVTSGP